MARKKRAWGPSNPLWRYLNNKKRTKRRTLAVFRRAGKRRVYSMARRRRFGRRSRGGGGGGQKLMGISTKGILKLGVLGAVAGALFSDQIASMVPVNLGPAEQFKSHGIAFAVGGPAGLVGKVAKDMLTKGGSSGGAAF